MTLPFRIWVRVQVCHVLVAPLLMLIMMLRMHSHNVSLLIGIEHLALRWTLALSSRFFSSSRIIYSRHYSLRYHTPLIQLVFPARSRTPLKAPNI